MMFFKYFNLVFILIVCASCKSNHVDNVLSRELNAVLAYDVFTDGPRSYVIYAQQHGDDELSVSLRMSHNQGTHWTYPQRIVKTSDMTTPRPGNSIQVAAHSKTVLVQWQVKGTGFRGSGPMKTAYSTDYGLHWANGYNPADDKSFKGHGFTDIAVVNDTFHMIWLDSRHGQQGLQYTSSRNLTDAWDTNKTVDPKTCQCCWNSLAVSSKGGVYALYRDIEPRDMALAHYDQATGTWSRLGVLGAFNWNFKGCPHTGGAITVDDSTVHSLVWTGKESKLGVYYVNYSKEGHVSDPIRIGGDTARNTDIAVLKDGRLIVVWDEVIDDIPGIMMSFSSDKGKSWTEPNRIKTEGNATYPRLSVHEQSYNVFWLGNTDGIQMVHTEKFEIESNQTDIKKE